uniref:Transporter subunit: ATP-binding component of ABC superfamily n=1 Tax=Magnetococcus massalia (strain MO-1) TaxID=451514 RepID=A0A1S7LPK5_MAGMO|nr:Transporter subunit: ATP-binding component of ABC superfamily [Candidatus Magnetococcus massalia]
MIELRSVRKAYNQGQHNELWAVDGIDLKLEDSRVTVFTGPSGSGKTTLLTLIGCLARPTEGRVALNGEDISALPERFLTQIRRHSFGFVFQRFNLIAGLSVRENVMLPAYPLGGDHKALAKRADELLEQLGLLERASFKSEWLSGGEAQRTAVARALINDPEVIIADEPTANLDTHLSREFLTIMESLVGQGKRILMTSHDPLVYDSNLVERRIAMRDGRLVEPALEPIAEPGSESIAEPIVEPVA